MEVEIGTATTGSRGFSGWATELSESEVRTVLLVEASEDGFSRGSARVAALAVRAFHRGFHLGASPSERVRLGFEETWRAMRALPGDDISGSPCAKLLAITQHEDRVGIAWIGTAEAMLVRRGTVVARSHGHTLGRQLIERGQATVEELRGVEEARIGLRAISGDAPFSAPEEIEWHVHGEDVVIALGGEAAPILDHRTIADIATSSTDPGAVARTLLVPLEQTTDFYRASAAVMRLTTSSVRRG